MNSQNKKSRSFDILFDEMVINSSIDTQSSQHNISDDQHNLHAPLQYSSQKYMGYEKSIENQKFSPEISNSEFSSIWYNNSNSNQLGNFDNSSGDLITSLINSNSDVIPPPVNHFHIDNSICQICGKSGIKHMKKHSLVHSEIPRYRCNFDSNSYKHVQPTFKRLGPFKLHLLKVHFQFDEKEIKNKTQIKTMISHSGTCPCGLRFTAKDWIQNHLLTNVLENRCPAFAPKMETSFN